MTPRRFAALRRMADQDDSPREREIAAAKLAEVDRVDDWRAAWADHREHERIREERARATREAQYAEIVKRWSSGTFAGLTARAGAGGTSTSFRKR